MWKGSLYQRVFGNHFSDADTSEKLDKWVSQYPWFSLGHFYRLKATSLNDKKFKDTAPIAALYFNNPFLLNDRLQQDFSQVSETIQPIQPELQDHEVDHPLPTLEPVTDNLPKEHLLNAEGKEKTEIEPVDMAKEKNSTEKENTATIGESATREQRPALHIPLFEPLHASDYFASQGIKLSEENLGDDQLGKKMRRFTDWLKTMKKTPLQESNLSTTNEDPNVTSLADKSNQDAEIITESMARVLELQGKTRKAKEIYEKLKLINPDKSAYFAAKIENLNEK